MLQNPQKLLSVWVFSDQNKFYATFNELYKIAI